MDAAERCMVQRGFRASTMEVIAAEAGYSRAGVYRQFPSKKQLVEAMAQRITQRKALAIVELLPPDAGLADVLVESLVIVATELVHDPVIQIISEHSDESGLASMLANDTALTRTVETLISPLLNADGPPVLRAGLHATDISQFLISTAISLLLNVIPGVQDADVARRFINVFVLPAILEHPPHARRVFTE
jgi:AcrR family transcriptional regulator